MRMRTQAEIIEELRAIDPKTRITPYFLRQAVLTGRIPSVAVGNKRLIDLDRIEEFLNAEYTAPAQETPKPQGIRPIPEDIRPTRYLRRR